MRIRNYELAYFISVLHTSLRGFPRSAYITQRISSFCIRHLEDFHVLHTSLRGFPRSAYVTQRISTFCIRHSEDFLVLHTSLRGFIVTLLYVVRLSLSFFNLLLKLAMSDQRLEGQEVLNIGWAYDDPNPRSRKKVL